MAKSKLLTAAVMSSALVLVACGGNTDDTDQGSTTTTEPAVEEVDTLELETDDESIELVVEDVEPVAVIEDAAEDVYNELLDLTLVYFDFDKSVIRPEFIDMLNAHSEFLVANPTQMVVLEGHADERGTREYNLALGERRAKQVATYLMVQGVSAAQIDTVSYGEEKPLAIGKTEAEYSQNRRVEIVYK
ncbi:peptidoglycan-associated lipoprotein Pal [Reinekea blandensis]|uniref:Peptidoglycan-associated lipoprotein n=1 Tax=Reinekea blandensis MED297 TaxID=314283 RepID=A4BHW7_9GAMM|nr:peptidoglycan-associated lipoprotein Pal [Reinekea blandensis]EAR08239.1 peptidoglycan-associated lipoprotein [Reinekea sp. MED297] [Reinekea blandensis MED297]